MAVAILSASVHFIRSWTDCALNLAFPWPESAEAAPTTVVPPYCRQCGEMFPALGQAPADFTCGRCAGHSWRFDFARSAYCNDGQVHESILGFKYYEQFYRRAQLVTWLTEVFDRNAAFRKWDGLVPVPLFHRRQRERGFNQAAELASGLGRNRQIRVKDCLYRYRETDSQVKLNRKARWANMADAFRMKRGFDVKGLNLLLIDDVFTTGATANACAQVLADAGAGQLAVLTVARS